MRKHRNFYVFTNFASSMDGKISTRDRVHIDPSPHDRYLMDFNRGRAHALLMGAGTLRAYRRPAIVQRRRFQLVRRVRGMKTQPINVVLTRHPDFDPCWDFFTDSRVERHLVVPQSADEALLKPFRDSCRIFRYADRPDFPEQIIEYLERLGCRNLLLEGGGSIMFPWVERDLIDEWNITLTPAIIGGRDAPTMVEGEGFDSAHIRRYRLRKSRRHGNELFLRYER